MLTNYEFAERVGCDFTMASRLKLGKRMPSADLLVRIIRAFELPPDEVIAAYEGGPTVFSRYLRTRVFGIPEEQDPGPEQQASDT